jgi:hypothetical protein
MTDLNFSNQVEMITLDELVSDDHIYRNLGNALLIVSIP